MMTGCVGGRTVHDSVGINCKNVSITEHKAQVS